MKRMMIEAPDCCYNCVFHPRYGRAMCYRFDKPLDIDKLATRPAFCTSEDVEVSDAID